MILNDLGEVALDRWLATPQFFPHVSLLEHVIMPDHMHAVIKFHRVDNYVNSGSGTFSAQRNTLGAVIRSYKGTVTSRLQPSFPTFKWQDRYDDQILLTSYAVDRACAYVKANPKTP